jgi:hypothetical protein
MRITEVVDMLEIVTRVRLRSLGSVWKRRILWKGRRRFWRRGNRSLKGSDGTRTPRGGARIWRIDADF